MTNRLATTMLAFAAAGFLSACGGGGGGPASTGGGGSGVVLTGEFDAARTPGTYNGEPGYFRCLSTSCGTSTTNGRVSLTGEWIFVPASQAGDDGTRSVPPGTRVYSGNVSISSSSVSGQPGSLHGESGTFACTGGCTTSDGRVTGGAWTFTPDRPPGAIDVSGTTTTPTPTTTPTRPGVQSADADAVRTAAAKAARNLPSFGSVTQSTVADSSASASFDGRSVEVAIRRGDGSRLVLDTGADTVPGFRESLDPAIPGYSYRSESLLTETATGVALSTVYTNWNDADSTDWLAGGYWMHVEGGVERVTGAEVGAFVYGPEITLSAPPTLPGAGTASYDGDIAGFYAWTGSPTDPDEVGEFEGDVRLTVNFAAGTMSGCMGCNGGVTVSGVTEHGEPFAATAPVRLRVGATPFRADGTFRGRNVSVERDDRIVTGTNGSWGGQFSNVPDADGDPRLVAGTAGAEWTESDGARGTFVGAWFGVGD